MNAVRASMGGLVGRWPLAFAVATVVAVPAMYAAGQWMAARLTERTLALWVERGQRAPKWMWKSPERASAVSPRGRHVALQSLNAVALAQYPLPVASPVTHIASTPQGWVAVTFDEGAFLLGASTVQPLPFGNRVNEVHVHRGATWAATDHGLWELPAKQDPIRRADGAFTSLASWRDALWALSRSGVMRIDAKGLTRWGSSFGFDADSPSVLRVCGEALCACASNGVFVFDGSTFTRRSAAGAMMPNDFASDVAFNGNTTWVGTFDAGLAQWSPEGVTMWTPRSGLPDGRVQPRTLAPFSSGTVFGTPSGLFSVEASAVREWMLTGHQFPAVSAITRAPDGSLFIGLTGSVVQIKGLEEPRI